MPWLAVHTVDLSIQFSLIYVADFSYLYVDRRSLQDN